MALTMDFTTTAVARPYILDETFRSFSENLQDIKLKDCRLIINVDPLPPEIKRKNVIKVARKYFGDVKYNFPETANFTQAYNWIWSNANSKLIFNLEDDWMLTTKISVLELTEYFEKNKKLLQVILRAYKYHYTTCALSPSIIHKRMYSAIAGKLNPDINPEAQLRGEKFGITMPTRLCKSGFVSSKGLITVHPHNVKRVILKDLGREWINKTKYKKTGKGKKAHFTTWENK